MVNSNEDSLKNYIPNQKGKRKIVMKKLWGCLLLALWGCASAFFLIKIINAADEKINMKDQEIKKFKLYFYLYSSWIDIKSKGKNLAEYLEHENINTIAVYGMGDIGIRLCKELQGTDIEIKYVMDQGISMDTAFAPVIKLDEKLPRVDAIIVTPINAYSQIKDILSSKIDSRILSIEDIVYNL